MQIAQLREQNDNMLNDHQHVTEQFYNLKHLYTEGLKKQQSLDMQITDIIDQNNKAQLELRAEYEQKLDKVKK